MNGQFSLKQFYRKLRIPKGERPLIEEMMAKGLEKYYYDLYGYHKYGKEPIFLIGERLGEPYIFGYTAVRILHHQDISARTKQRVAEYTLTITRPGEEHGVPHGLLVAINYLTARGHLRGHRLASAIRCLDGEQDIFVGLTKEDTTALADGIIADQELPVEERLEKTLCTWLIHGREDLRREGFSLLEALMRGEGPEAFSRLTGAHFGLVPDYLKRAAIVGLVQVEGNPTTVARRFLGAGERYDAKPFDQAVADIIEALHQEMRPAEAREMVEQGIHASAFQTRLRFYQLGLKLYGPEFIRPALEDRSSKVRKWAGEHLQKEE